MESTKEDRSKFDIKLQNSNTRSPIDDIDGPDVIVSNNKS